MNPNNIRMPQDRRKVYNEYIANLDAQIENLSKTENAVRTLATTGQAPVQPTDTRSLNEKLLDVEGQKRALRLALRDVTDGENINLIMKDISDEDVVFLALALPEFAKLLKSKFAGGVPAPIFNDYLKRYKSDYIATVSSQQGKAQGKSTDELQLNVRELARLAPNSAQLRDLKYAVQQVSRSPSITSSMMDDMLEQIDKLDLLLPTEENIAQLNGMDIERQNDAQQAFNDGMSDITTGVVVQELTKQLQQASTPAQTKSIFEQILGNIVLTAHDRDALAIAQGIAQSKSAQEIQARLEKVSKYKSVQVPRGMPQMPSEKALAIAMQIEELSPDDYASLDNFQTSALRDYVRMKGIESGDPIPTNQVRKMERPELMALVDKIKNENWTESSNIAEGILPPNLQAYKELKGKQRTRQEQLASIVQPPIYDLNEFLTLDEFRDNLTYDQKVDYFKKLRDDGDVDLLGKSASSQLQKALNAGPTEEGMLDMFFGDLLTIMDDANEEVNLQHQLKEGKKLDKKARKKGMYPSGEESFMMSEPEPVPVPVQKKKSKAQLGVEGMISSMKEKQLGDERAREAFERHQIEKGFKEVPKPSKKAQSIPVAEKMGTSPYTFATPVEIKAEKGESALREIASKSSFDKMDAVEKRNYFTLLITNPEFDNKLGKGDLERIEKLIATKKELTEPQQRFMMETNDKLLKKHGTEGYGIAHTPMKMKISEIKSAHKGKRIAFGCGGFLKPSLTVSPETVEEIASVPAEKSYAKLGRYLVNKHRLRDNQLIMRTVKGGQIVGLPSMTVSPKLGKMINKIVSGRGFPSHDELGEMCDSDKDIMYKIFKMSKAEGLESLPKSTLKNKQERDFNEFTIAKGELMAGNNSPELIKKFKTLLLRLMNDGQIVRREGHDILMDLVALGF